MTRELWKLPDIFIICSVLITKSTTAQFPNFYIQANDSLITAGDTVVINCLLYNAPLIDIITNRFTITWLKDEVKLTQGYTRLTDDVINDQRYSVNIHVGDNLKMGMVSSMQITGITKEDEGTFTCELTNRMNAKQRKSISISVDDPEDQTRGSDIATVVFDSRLDHNKRQIGLNADDESNTQTAKQPYENTSILFTNWTDAEEHNSITTPTENSITTPADSSSTTPADNNITTPADNNIDIPADGNIVTPSDDNITTPAGSNINTPADNNITTPADNNIDIPADGNIVTPSDDNITTPAGSNINTPADSNITTPADSNITTPVDSNITTPVDSNDITPLLMSTDAIVENTSLATGIEKKEDENDVLIAVIVMLPIFILVVIILFCCFRKRYNLYCKSFYHRTEYDNSTPGENIQEYGSIEPVVYQNYMYQAQIRNEEPKFARKNWRQPYEDAHDRTFLNEYENSNTVQRGSSDAKRRNRNAGVCDQIELSDVYRNTSNQNLLATHREISYQNVLPARDQESVGGSYALKKAESPYEACNNIDFMKTYE